MIQIKTDYDFGLVALIRFSNPQETTEIFVGKMNTMSDSIYPFY